MDDVIDVDENSGADAVEDNVMLDDADGADDEVEEDDVVVLLEDIDADVLDDKAAVDDDNEDVLLVCTAALGSSTQAMYEFPSCPA